MLISRERERERELIKAEFNVLYVSIVIFFFQNLSLKLYYRMFAAHTANVTKTVYLSLVDILSQLFQGGVVTLSMGVDPADDRCIQLLAKVSYQCKHSS